MRAELKQFRDEHDCRDCLYYRNKCNARDRCAFDFLPLDSSDEEIELFFVT